MVKRELSERMRAYLYSDRNLQRIKTIQFKKGCISTWKGKHPTEETRQKMRENHADVKGEKNPHYGVPSFWRGKKRSEEFKAKQRANRMKQNFMNEQTSIERKIQEELTKRGYAYYLHYFIKGRPDIAFPDLKLAVFLDGTYWHSFPERVVSDKRVNQELQTQGWLVLRYSDKEINCNPVGVVDEIEEVLMSRR
jgi:DNA mismatch endonuclease (patch repair protein)